eukprot:CAMPEP_0181246674 /NCGR_PEP_ID=MMETSP1096-20121128/44131_1 /TAXON_ID=156174 ORGANISM="Chrysochromulina ericina, Strain CCMP281" /NCGR_SAMPLE_ID=MMETSP1096 /ASSEMBLY_ACC=CAM_ASM_000453 /LENGTH=78 /DNA_ID=CAMNT_0023343529 /DNA_START=206 /DNA_END=442 /DNA_ORIENTATION=-
MVPRAARGSNMCDETGFACSVYARSERATVVQGIGQLAAPRARSRSPTSPACSVHTPRGPFATHTAHAACKGVVHVIQ